MLCRCLAVVLAGLSLSGCAGSDPTGPATDVTLGETTFVVLVNPTVNTGNGVTIPAAGSVRSGVDVTWETNNARTDATGVAVLRNVAVGTRSFALSGGGLAGSVSASIAQ